MTHYRLYLLDDEDHIHPTNPPVDLDCANDDEAIAMAATYVDGHTVELWEKTRKVVRLPAKPQPSETRDKGDT